MSKAGKAVDVGVVSVTPKQAREWLEANEVNRNVRPKLVNAYRRDMENGRWVFTAEPIQISRTGQLLNGQHRLSALAGSTGVRNIDFVVATGLPDSAQAMMDQGVSRGIRDALLIQHGHVKNITIVGSIARWMVLAPEIGPQLNPNAMRNKVTAAEALEVFNANAEAIEWAGYHAARLRPVLPGSPTAVGYTWTQLAMVDAEATVEFFAGISDMEWSYPNDPRKAALRRMVSVHRDQEIKASIETGVMLVSVMTRAWNAWRKQEEVETIPVRKSGNQGSALILPVKPV